MIYLAALCPTLLMLVGAIESQWRLSASVLGAETAQSRARS